MKHYLHLHKIDLIIIVLPFYHQRRIMRYYHKKKNNKKSHTSDWDAINNICLPHVSIYGFQSVGRPIKNQKLGGRIAPAGTTYVQLHFGERCHN